MILASHAYSPVLILLLGLIGIVFLIMVLTHKIGAGRHGPRKDTPYEAGMPVHGDTKRRFRARFYVLALLFLLFDVEVVLLWPWAVAYHRAATAGESTTVGDTAVGAGFLLAAMMVFVALLVVGLVYEWGRGALKSS
jgi:NADH-quinone oxidoreductase subunit A